MKLFISYSNKCASICVWAPALRSALEMSERCQASPVPPVLVWWKKVLLSWKQKVLLKSGSSEEEEFDA